MLKTEKVNAGYGKLQILFDVSVEAEKGKITTIVGPNGSGKSTFLKTVFGLTTVYSGRILFKGTDVTKLPPFKRTRMGMAYLPQTNNVFANLTVMENLRMAGYILSEEEFKERLELALSVFPEIKNLLKRKAGNLSGGQRQFLAMATALIRNSELLLLDEPTAQLAPKLADVIFGKIVEMRDDHGLTVLLVEQNAKKALEISDKGYMLVSGRVFYEGDPVRLITDDKFQRHFLGIIEDVEIVGEKTEKLEAGDVDGCS
ncbi:ABC transporter ATP-binding protein [Thermococcus sp. GR6]|uniref:branched-chain amino acid ABC transporter ATP-binding protein n=1 Tax=Thermococcus sp. GR6 TaxID=1638256 RepID=UPI0014317CC2|nr:ABC transporter ATP-binding protein [Thermococcus sp. GR6]NJE42626.1 ABC transporter ATP-binding protein [Thermococcus sp. GR6]